MNEKSSFSIALVPGLITSAAVIAYSLITWSLTSDFNTQKYLGFGSYLILALAYYYYAVQYRDKYKNGGLTYGEGFVFMVILSVIVAFFQSIYTYVFIKWIDPSMLNQVIEQATEEMYNKNIPEDQIEKSLQIMSFMFKPWFMALTAIFGYMFWGVLLGLIMAVFTKKEVPENFEIQ